MLLFREVIGQSVAISPISGNFQSDSVDVPEALVSLELAADAVPPVQGEVVRAGAAVEVDDSHSGSTELTRDQLCYTFHNLRTCY